jgi:hypothetical protein
VVRRTGEEEARRTVLVEDPAVQESGGRTAAVEEGELHNGLEEVQEVRRNAVVEEAVADSHHRVVEAEEVRLGEDNDLAVADTRFAGEDIVQEEVVDNRRMVVVEVGDIGHSLGAAAALEAFKSELLSQSVYMSTYGRREHHNLGKT